MIRAGLALITCLLLSANAHGQDASGGSSGTTVSRLDRPTVPLQPHLLAISVSDVDSSVAWYRDVLGFRVDERYDFPEDDMRLAFVEKDGFTLELIEIADSEPFSPPNSGNPATRRGFVKFAFYTSASVAVSDRAIEAGARIQSTLRPSNRTGGRFLILLDPDGNQVQVYGPAE